MAVARMLKVTVLAHQESMDDLVERMQMAGVLEIERTQLDLPSAAVPLDDDRLLRLEEYLADATFVRDFLARFHVSDQPFGAFVSEKIHLSTDEYYALEADHASLQLYRECQEISSKTATLERERARLRQTAHDLEPWEQLHLQISGWQGTEHVVLFTGTVPAAEGLATRQVLREATRDVTVEELQSVGGRAAWVVMAHRSVLEDVHTTLALTNFQEVAFPGLADYPAEERARALARADEITAEMAKLDEEARTLAADHYHRSVALAETIASEIDSLTVREHFGTTERAFAVTGWVRASRREDLESALEPLAHDVDLTYEEPAEGDAPPVVLKNPRLIRPFETLTELYGLPRYDEIDPTPLLAPFFFVFFGICIGDVGYGLMLIGGAWLIKNKIDVAPGVVRFMDLLMLGGVASIIAGVLFGSYFALEFAIVEAALPFLGRLQIIDPLQQLPVFLVAMLVLGMVQLVFGVLISVWDLTRRGDRAGAFFDRFSTILMFAMIGVGIAVPPLTMVAIALAVGITALFKGRALEVAVNGDGISVWDRALALAWMALLLATLGVWGAGLAIPVGWAFLAATAIGLAFSKAIRRSVVAVLGGLYAIYSMTGFVGDVLSYTRLAALGLSSMLVGMVFNILARLVMGGAGDLFARGGSGIATGILVVVLGSVVFAVGHTFNVVINLLSAFVHPARLQFVEFFTKFYQGGGTKFSPFTHRTKSLVLHAGGVRQEGAGS